MTDSYPIPDFLRRQPEQPSGPRERPVLFSAPMVRAILAGTKTQTRRVVKLPANAKHVQYWTPPSGKSEPGWADPGVNYWTPDPSGEADSNHLDRCPYGQPGDRLWVREKCQAYELPSGLDGVRYLADDSFTPIENSEEAAERWGELACYGMKKSGPPECRNVPSIHMPRWASRILLEITAVRVERLNGISETDAEAEGIQRVPVGKLITFTVPGTDIEKLGARAAYEKLWESINGPGSWEANPWVWIVEFKRVQP